MALPGSTSGTQSCRRDISPHRTKVVWTQPPNSHRRVPVVYYLSRNGQLEHPHFIEVPLSSSSSSSSPQGGLFLRDVISRLNVLRGNGMAAMYSWSCKRSYKNGFVWQDLSEDDFIYPAHANEYVLKGSELLGHSFLDTEHAPPPPETQSADADAAYHHRRRRNQSCSSIEYSVYKAEHSFRSAADASTQTDDARRQRHRPPPPEEKSKETQRDEIEISPPPSDSSPETLETLLKGNGASIAQAVTVKKESRAKAESKSSVLMQLISCGSMSLKDCGAGQVISQYRMRVPRGGGGGGRVKMEEKEYFSGSIVETKKLDSLPKLKRSTSYNATDR